MNRLFPTIAVVSMAVWAAQSASGALRIDSAQSTSGSRAAATSGNGRSLPSNSTGRALHIAFGGSAPRRGKHYAPAGVAREGDRHRDGEYEMIAPPNLHDGARIMDVQSALEQHGYDPGPGDGVLGPETREAIAKFQKEHGLPRTGRIDGRLLDAL